jgi:hypothetical protein
MPSEHDKIDRERVVVTLNTILELELAGVVRYVHYSLMVFGHARIPIIGWMGNQAIEGRCWANLEWMMWLPPGVSNSQVTMRVVSTT